MESVPPLDKIMLMFLQIFAKREVPLKITITMNKNINIATWNLCLGIANKKDTFTAYLTANEIQICCLQETGIPMGFPDNLLNCNGYYIELEMNSLKKKH